MKKSMFFIPLGLVAIGSCTYMLMNKTQKKQMNKVVRDVKNSMDNMMS